MRASKIFAFTAIATSMCATAAIAATQVNITDPTATTRAAKVEPGNRLAVQEVAPATYYHSAALTLGNCTQIAAPAAGKALIVRQVKVNVFNSDTAVSLYTSADCSIGTLVADSVVSTVGHDTITFDPGLAVPSGGVLSAHNSNTANPMNAFVDGYTVASGVAPTVGQTIEVRGNLQGRR